MNDQPETSAPAWWFDIRCFGTMSGDYCGRPCDYQVSHESRHGISDGPMCVECLALLRSGKVRCGRGCCVETVRSAYSLPLEMAAASHAGAVVS